PQSVRFALFIGLVSIALVATLIYVMRSKRLSGLQVAMLAMIVSGGVGNLIDRIRNEGVVVDFLNVGIGSLRTGVFNIADMAVTGGVLALLFTSFSESKAQIEAETSGDDPSDVPDDQIPS
ncbi:MAG: signal peptidase II, partial [Candidatus Eisenbacteria bacterium]|nr:signal peptidase II [Candidatus Eisenbacteria bacterium]